MAQRISGDLAPQQIDRPAVPDEIPVHADIVAETLIARVMQEVDANRVHA